MEIMSNPSISRKIVFLILLQITYFLYADCYVMTKGRSFIFATLCCKLHSADQSVHCHNSCRFYWSSPLRWAQKDKVITFCLQNIICNGTINFFKTFIVLRFICVCRTVILSILWVQRLWSIAQRLGIDSV